jgi:hypothetical protein
MRRSAAGVSKHEAAASGDDAHDVGLLHDQEILAVEHDLGARPLAEQHLVEGFSLAVSGMMMPPLDFSSASMRFTTTRSCNGRNLVLAILDVLVRRSGAGVLSL